MESELLCDMRNLLVAEIAAAGGRLPFDRYMELALYAPGLGYYVNGRAKLGRGGDFTTAPEISPLFGHCLAAQIAECMDKANVAQVLELGAGSGRLAVDILKALAGEQRLPEAYLILEPSPSLQAEQAELLAAAVPDLLPRIRWLQRLPDPGFRGVIIGNEVLDAMPVHRFRRAGHGWQEAVVEAPGGDMRDAWVDPFSPGLDEALRNIWPGGDEPAAGYQSEVNLRLQPWVDSVAACLQTGYLLLIDYGYARREYYHAERSEGTLICHFRHRAFIDPYRLPGLQDITSNVDFTALAEGGLAAGMSLAGYTTQAHFLIGTGIDRVLGSLAHADAAGRLDLLQGVKRLTLPSEMGERFKVMCLVANAPTDLVGFHSRDLRDRL